MKKKNFKKIALLGLMSGLIAASQGNAQQLDEEQNGNLTTDQLQHMIASKCGKHGCGGYTATRDADASYDKWESNNSKNYYSAGDSSYSTSQAMTEKDLLSQLNSESKALYMSLDDEGKALALKLASQQCKGQNDCKGQNSCKSENNSCAGQGGCKGTSVGPFKDKNVAVKIAAKKMAEKRSQSTKNSSYSTPRNSGYQNGSTPYQQY